MLMEESREASGKIGLGCEFPRVWEKLGLDWVGYMGGQVYQYSDATKTQY